MQLYAFDQKGRLTAAIDAKKETDYFCLECNSLVRLRGGFHRQKHYFHLQQISSCRLNGKSLPHLHLQKRLQDAFPYGAIQLEQRFPTLGRIGDAVHEGLKIVFEIQCSPISAKEVEERNKDYKKEGYRVLWIFHDQLYNKRRLSHAEFFLTTPHYFTNIDREGKGCIYDQYSLRKGVVRKTWGEKMGLDVTQIAFLEGGAGVGREKWEFHIQGDHFDRMREDKGYACKWLSAKESFWKKLNKFYWIFFGTLLERATR